MNLAFQRGDSLSRRLLLWFVVVALLPLALFGYLSLRSQEQTMRAAAISQMSRIADRKTLQIKNYLTERTKDVELLARSGQTESAMVELSRAYARSRDEPASDERAAAHFDKHFSSALGDGEAALFYDVFLITMQGEIIYTHKREADFATNLLHGPYQNSQLAEAFRESRITLDTSVFDFEMYAPSAAPAAFISAPIIREGVPLGVLAFQLDAQRIYQVATDNTGLGATGQTMLLKLTGPDQALFVAPLRSDEQAALKRTVDLRASALPLRSALSGQRGSGVTFDQAGKEIVAAWRYLPELRWGVVVAMDADEALAPIFAQRNRLMVALIAIALCGGLVALFFGLRLVVPLKAFARTADEISNGDLSQRVDESRTDEVGALARSFNRMTQNLQRLYGSLEGRVEERTRELNLTNDRLQKELAERAQIEQALKTSRDQYERLTANIPIGVYVMRTSVTGSLAFGYASARFCAMLGVTLEEVRGNVDVVFQAIHPEDRTNFVTLNQRAAQTHQPIAWEGRMLVDGVTRWLRVEARPEPLRDGECLWNGVVVDITERKQAETSTRLAVVGTLAAGAAHEINNPLAFILVNIDWVGEELRALRPAVPTERQPQCEEAIRALDDAYRGAMRVRDIVAGLKAFARRDEAPRAPTDVVQAMRSALQLTHAHCKDQAVTVTHLTEVPLVLATARQLEQVFVNLLINAAQAIPSGQATSNQITVAVRRGEAAEVVIEVQDTGTGIAPEVRAHLFEPFFTTKPVGTGTGLGLSVCHGIISSLGGRIEVESAPGCGSTFRVVLPGLGPDAVEAAPPPKEPLWPVPTGFRVLVVDDDVAVAKAVARSLADGPEVVIVNDAREALARVESGERFDVVVCDLMMPTLSGEDFQAKLRPIVPALANSIIFITGGAFTSGSAAFLESTKSAHLEKPFAPNALRRLVARQLEVSTEPRAWAR